MNRNMIFALILLSTAAQAQYIDQTPGSVTYADNTQVYAQQRQYEADAQARARQKEVLEAINRQTRILQRQAEPRTDYFAPKSLEEIIQESHERLFGKDN